MPPATRDRLLALCARHLAPGGVAVISYNTLPGWHVQSTIRELMLAHVWGAGVEPGNAAPATPREVMTKAREVLEVLAAADPAEAPFAVLLKEAASQLRTAPDASLLHDYLCPINEPVYFSRFTTECAATGLRYLGDALTQSSNPPGIAERNAALGDEPPPTLAQIAPLPAHRELFLDAWSNRSFRQSLLCRADAPPGSVEGDVGPSSATPFAADARHVRRLLVSSSMKPTSLSEPEFGTPAPKRSSHRAAPPRPSPSPQRKAPSCASPASGPRACRSIAFSKPPGPEWACPAAPPAPAATASPPPFSRATSPA